MALISVETGELKLRFGEVVPKREMMTEVSATARPQTARKRKATL